MHYDLDILDVHVVQDFKIIIFSQQGDSKNYDASHQFNT